MLTKDSSWEQETIGAIPQAIGARARCSNENLWNNVRQHCLSTAHHCDWIIDHSRQFQARLAVGSQRRWPVLWFRYMLMKLTITWLARWLIWRLTPFLVSLRGHALFWAIFPQFQYINALLKIGIAWAVRSIVHRNCKKFENAYEVAFVRRCW
jgi:hypothetical protein